MALPAGVSVAVDGRKVSVKGAKGALDFELHPTVAIVHENNELKLVPQSEAAEHRAMAGTMRALVANMVTGVSRASSASCSWSASVTAPGTGAALNLTLGFSHPVVFDVPQGHHRRDPDADRNPRQGRRQR